MGAGHGLYLRHKQKNKLKTNSVPEIPSELADLLKPKNWTNEQWDYYGEEYLQRISHDEER